MKLHELVVDELFGNPEFRVAVMDALTARGGSLTVPENATRADAPERLPVTLRAPVAVLVERTEGYQILDPEDIVQSGDEWTLASNPGRGWRTVADSIGTPASRWTRSIFRRRIATPTASSPDMVWLAPGVLPPHDNPLTTPASTDYQYARLARGVCYTLDHAAEWVYAGRPDAAWASCGPEVIPGMDWIIRRRAVAPASIPAPQPEITPGIVLWGDPGELPPHDNPSIGAPSAEYEYTRLDGPIRVRFDHGVEWVHANRYDGCWAYIPAEQAIQLVHGGRWILRRRVPVPIALATPSTPRTFTMEELPWGEPGAWPSQSTGNPQTARQASAHYRYAFIRRGDKVASHTGTQPEWVAANTHDTLWGSVAYNEVFDRDSVLRIPA